MYGTVRHVNVNPEWLAETLDFLLLEVALELEPKALREFSRLLREKAAREADLAAIDVDEDNETGMLTATMLTQVSWWAGQRADYLETVHAGRERPNGRKRSAILSLKLGDPDEPASLRWIHGPWEVPEGTVGLKTLESVDDFISRRAGRTQAEGPDVDFGPYSLHGVASLLFEQPWSAILYLRDADGALSVVGVGEADED